MFSCSHYSTLQVLYIYTYICPQWANSILPFFFQQLNLLQSEVLVLKCYKKGLQEVEKF